MGIVPFKGCPYDNAVAESTFKIFKSEFVYRRNFPSLEALRLELGDYILGSIILVYTVPWAI